jgi:dGTPase
LDCVERKGRGWNLSLQTLDGILCHDGEVHTRELAPRRNKTFSDLQAEMAAKVSRIGTELIPMTLEGCVVRMVDTVAYIGRDIEDAIRLGLIERSDLPASSAAVLGNTNGTIVFRLATDIIRASHGNDFVAFSPEVSEALKQLKQFNLDRIYLNPRMKPHCALLQDLFKRLFNRFLEDLETQRSDSVIFQGFLNGMSDDYLSRHGSAEVVRDFIAGMTDRYFLDLCPEEMRPGYLPGETSTG